MQPLFGTLKSTQDGLVPTCKHERRISVLHAVTPDNVLYKRVTHPSEDAVLLRPPKLRLYTIIQDYTVIVNHNKLFYLDCITASCLHVRALCLASPQRPQRL